MALDGRRAAIGLSASSSAKGRAPTHEGDPFDKLPPKMQEERFQESVFLDKGLERERSLDTQRSLVREVKDKFDATDVGKTPPLGALPVVVLSSSPAGTESERHTTDGAAARLDFLSSNTVHITAAGSGHEIHLYQPEIVVAR